MLYVILVDSYVRFMPDVAVGTRSYSRNRMTYELVPVTWTECTEGQIRPAECMNRLHITLVLSLLNFHDRS